MDRTQLKTILYVDDEADIREIVQMALGIDEDIIVHTCESGERADLRPTNSPRLGNDVNALRSLMISTRSGDLDPRWRPVQKPSSAS